MVPLKPKKGETAEIISRKEKAGEDTMFYRALITTMGLGFSSADLGSAF